MQKTILFVTLMAMVLPMAVAGCGDDDSNDGRDAGVSVCDDNTEVRTTSEPLITDFDTVVTGQWAAADTVAELVDDASSTAFHWSTGTATSATLVWPSAMVNSEVNHSCTNASAFTGIQLDIKGSVTTTGPDYYGTDWTDTVSVGVVTAATYPAEYGGDATTDCGSYFWAVPVTSDWQTVTLDFADIQAPWNIGVCPDVTSLPVDQILGINLSIDSTYTDFDLSIDNVEFK